MELNKAFTIAGLEFEPLTLAHVEALLPMYKEPETHKYIPPLRDKSTTFYTAFLGDKVIKNSTGVGFWVVRESGSSAIIGTANLNLFEPLNVVHVGCHLYRSYWGHGWGTRIISALIRYGFEVRNLPIIHAIVSPNHAVSKAMLSTVGFTFLKEEPLQGETVEVYQIRPQK